MSMRACEREMASNAASRMSRPMRGSKSARRSIFPRGVPGHLGAIAGTDRLDFPTEAQRLFLRTGANQVAIAVDRWRAEMDERRFAALAERSADFIAFASLEGATVRA
jgi:hypothetical protein